MENSATQTTTPMETPNFNQIATLFDSNQNEYYKGNTTPLENLSLNLELFISAIEPLTRVSLGTIRRFVKVFRNYVATSTDEDKDEIIKEMVSTSGIFALLEGVTSRNDTFSLWYDYLQTLSQQIEFQQNAEERRQIEALKQEEARRQN